jgi:hypothetical protein
VLLLLPPPPLPTLSTSVADPDPGSGAFLTPGFGIRNRFFRIPDPKPILLTIFLGEKFYNSFKIDPHFFLQTSKNKIIYNFVKFVAIRKGMTTNFFSPLSFVTDFGSGIRDPRWVKIRIRDSNF